MSDDRELEPASPTPTEQGKARVKATVNLILEILDDYAPDSGLGTARQYVEHSLGTMGAGYRFEELLSAQTEQGEARVECPSCGSNHPRRKKRVQHSPGRPFASKWCDDGFHEPAPEGEGEAS